VQPAAEAVRRKELQNGATLITFVLA